MAIQSYVDLCYFVRFIHVRRDQIPLDVLRMLLSVSPTDKDSLTSAWVEQMAAISPITFHENYHFWQGLRLPFLHRYAILSFFVVGQAFKKLSEQIPELHDWDCMLPELYRLVLEAKICVFPDGKLAWGGVTAPMAEAHIGPLLLSPRDLLEEAASLAEFQVHTPRSEHAAPKTFSRWVKRHPAYVKALPFVTQYLDDEVLTLRCFIPIVNAAFHTSDPVRAFAVLIANLKRNLDYRPIKEALLMPEPILWDDICRDLMDSLPFEAKPDSDAQILGSPFHRLTLHNWVFNDSFEHPFLTPLARKWCEAEATNPAYSRFLSQPGWGSVWGGQGALEMMSDFAPSISLIRFHIDGQHNLGFATVNEFPDGTPFVDLMTLYSVVRRASGSHYDADSRLCHHNKCPEYGPNFCNCFPKIPTEYADCEFRHRVEVLRDNMSRRTE